MGGLALSAGSAAKVHETRGLNSSPWSVANDHACNENTLDAQAMLARAQAETGLYNWSDATLPERFGLAVDTAQRGDDGCRRSSTGGAVCHWLLTSRLECFEDRNRYPIADEVIERPMFVTGEPRTGTTLMHAMMSVEPRVPRPEVLGGHVSVTTAGCRWH